MGKSVQFEDPLQDLKQLEMLCGCGSQEVSLGLPLKKLDVYLKQDDELQGQDEEAFLNGDWEEGEIWIACSNGCLTSITVNDAGLVGEFSSSAITGLKMLPNLSISNNQRTGTISKLRYKDVRTTKNQISLWCSNYNTSNPVRRHNRITNL
ncbi:PREDICTED: probable [Prunus dulcis]|uniref:PREDICTED: probable n=1 Tax=Prunus dulcis TaxID=3755 RepID=A0A5E4GD63_PRUDU|nr:PREDICTED: probable [Prunus dulcis]VVA37478.1 PREDICTED: probable [Prunus dulcis]